MSTYPEKIPEGLSSIDTFPFSVKAGKLAKKDIESQLDAVNSRIDKIVDHFIFSDTPILMFILRLTDKKSDLKKLSKALDRVADLVEVQSDLNSRLSVLKVLESDPNWFATTFSDYSDEIDRDISFIIDNK
jgi:hypothetical protein